jgi:hypothetical protein
MLALVLGAVVSTLIVSFLEQAYVILPSDAATIRIARCIGRSAVAWTVAQIIARLIARPRVASESLPSV